ncbi:MAG: hypothetical protein ACLPPV_07525 [Candidatus Korobacteraceae bacterium]
MANAVPVGVTTLRKNENHRPAVVIEVGIARYHSVGADVVIISVLQIVDDGIGFAGRVGIVLVVHNGDLEAVFGRNLLHQGIGLVFEIVSRAVPVDDEGCNSKLFRLLDLLLNDDAILGRVANVNVSGTPEPGKVSGKHGRLGGSVDKTVGRERRVEVGAVTS